MAAFADAVTEAVTSDQLRISGDAGVSSVSKLLGSAVMSTFCRLAGFMSRMDDFEGFANGNADGLLRTAFLLVRDQQEAEDLVQECLLRVARHWPRVHRMDHPLAYARRILLNLARDGARQRQRRAVELSAQDVWPMASGADAIEGIELRDELLGALAGLPFHQHAVLVLRYFNDLSERQTADALGCSTGAVKTSASRGLTKLRLALSPTTGEALR